MFESELGDLAIVILAAGSSRRFGGRNKLLEPICGRPLIGHLFDAVADLHLGHAIVVTGHGNDEIEALAASCGLDTVHNPYSAAGMGTSIAAGTNAVGNRFGAVLVQLGDVPFVSPDTFAALAHAWRSLRQTKNPIVAPTFEGQRGHPVLFDRCYFPKLRALRGDRGAKLVITDNTSALCHVPVNDPFIIRDFDTLDDIRELIPPSRTNRS